MKRFESSEEALRYCLDKLRKGLDAMDDAMKHADLDDGFIQFVSDQARNLESPLRLTIMFANRVISERREERARQSLYGTMRRILYREDEPEDAGSDK